VARRAYPRRYAQAVFELARDSGKLDAWSSDLVRVASLGEDAALMAWLESPRFPFDDKVKLLAERLSDINPLAVNLACLLVARGRLGMAGDIADEYQRLLDSYHGIERAEVTTATPIDEEDKKRLGERISKLIGKEVVLKTEVDPELIGGVVARVGGKLLDGSTRSRLQALKRELQR